MEVAGTVVGVIGLAGLYSTCIATLDMLSAAARFGIQREMLQTKIEIERVRLMVWGASVGLTDLDLDPSKPETAEDDLDLLSPALQRESLRTAVAGLLACFARTSEDVEALQKRYGLMPQTEDSSNKNQAGTAASKPTREMLSATFRKTYASFRDRARTAQAVARPATRVRWAVADEPKFRALIAELRAINDSLTSLVPAARDKARVRIRTEIMQSSDIAQLQNLVNAGDDADDLIAETASLRIEMLSTTGPNAPRRPPTARPVPVVRPDLSADATTQRTFVPEATGSAPGVGTRTGSPLPVPSQHTGPATPQASQQASFEPMVYDDSGALVIHKVYYKQDSLACYAWLSGVGEVPELYETQPPFHPAFASAVIPDSLLDAAGKLLEMDVRSDPKYAGWSPGSTSISGFAREINYWRGVAREASGADMTEPQWKPVPMSQPSHSISYIRKRWKEVLEGLGDDWTEREGYKRVRELVGPSAYTWLDSEEKYKIRHQITDLLAAMGSAPMPSAGIIGSIGLLVFGGGQGFNFANFLLQMLEARELSLRMARAQRSWYGGVTIHIVYDMIASELWAKKMKPKGEDSFEASRQTREEQLDGIVKFAEEMQWPHADEMRQTAAQVLGPEGHRMQIQLGTFDWVNGLVLPGGLFSRALIRALYSMSPTLLRHQPQTGVSEFSGNHGIVYPQASYWNVRSVVGKVLAPLSLSDSDHTGVASTIKCLGGWVGPCPSPSLPESTFGLVVELQARPPTFVTPEADGNDGASLTIVPITQSKRGDTTDWEEPVPPPQSTQIVKLQTLRLTRVEATRANQQRSPMVMGDQNAPQYRARLDFQLARSKTMVTMTLHGNSVFAAAPSCRGMHRIDPHDAAKYPFRVLGVEDLAHAEMGPVAGPAAVTVINATGGHAAETFARAWCSQKGTNAVVWERGEGKCCFKCALMTAGTNGLGTGVLIIH